MTEPTQHYFAADGNYGDAAGLVILDTTDWTPDHWRYVESLSEGERAEIAEDIMLGYGDIDQQDCPAVASNGMGDDLQDCGFTGYVYRHFDYPAQGSDGGYSWTCPNCGTVSTFEGIDPDDPDHFIGVVEIKPED